MTQTQVNLPTNLEQSFDCKQGAIRAARFNGYFLVSFLRSQTIEG